MKQHSIYLKVKDHSVSGQDFNLTKNNDFGFLETTPQPEAESLPSFYKTADYISHTDSKRNWFEKLYHIVRNYALKQKLKLINDLFSNEKKLLDVGCGTGDFLKTAQNDNWEVSGIEPNETARKIANQKTKGVVFGPEKLQEYPESSFEIITLWHVLEHLPKLEDQLSLFKKLLKQNGTLIIAVPNYNSFDAKYYKNFWAAYDVPRHLWHFNQESIAKIFATINMKVVKTLPMKRDAYYVSLLSEKYKSGFTNPLKAFFIGFRSNWKAKRTSEYSSLIYVIKNS